MGNIAVVYNADDKGPLLFFINATAKRLISFDWASCWYFIFAESSIVMWDDGDWTDGASKTEWYFLSRLL